MSILTKTTTESAGYGREQEVTSLSGIGWALIVSVVLLVIFAPITYAVSTSAIQQDSVGFVRGGGPFDGKKNKLKSDLEPAGRIVHGTLDKVWQFPSYKAIRFQDYETTVTTRDGKKVTVKGQLGFRFIGEKNPALAREFAEGVGARKYDGKFPGDGGGDGWSAFLKTMVLTEINAAAKQSFGNAYCADFEPACRVIDPRADAPPTRPDDVYGPMAAEIERRVAKKLGGAYFVDFRFVVRSITLPEQIQANIDALGREQASTRAAEQANKTAEQRAKAIKTLGDALKRNPSQVGVEIVKECAGKCTVILDGTGKGATVAQGVR